MNTISLPVNVLFSDQEGTTDSKPEDYWKFNYNSRGLTGNISKHTSVILR